LKESAEKYWPGPVGRLTLAGMEADTDTIGPVGRRPTQLPRDLARQLRRLARARTRSDEALGAAIVAAIDAGYSQSAIARELGVSPQAIQQRVTAARASGEVRRNGTEPTESQGLDSEDQPKP